MSTCLSHILVLLPLSGSQFLSISITEYDKKTMLVTKSDSDRDNIALIHVMHCAIALIYAQLAVTCTCEVFARV